MLDNKQYDHFYKLFNIFSRVTKKEECFATAAKHLKQYIIDNGEKHRLSIETEMAKPKEDKNKKNFKDLAKEFIENVIALKDEVRKILKEVLNSESIFQKAIDEGFQNFINRFDHSPRLLAQYSDFLLRNTVKYRLTLENELIHIHELF